MLSVYQLGARPRKSPQRTVPGGWALAYNSAQKNLNPSLLRPHQLHGVLCHVDRVVIYFIRVAYSLHWITLQASVKQQQ